MGEKTEAQKRAQQKYMEKFVRVEIRMGAEQRNEIQARADAQHDSINGFINRAIEEAMKHNDEVSNIPVDIDSDACGSAKTTELPEMNPEEQLDVIEAAKEGWAWVPNGEKKKKSAGRPNETRELYRIINEGIASMVDNGKPPIEHTADTLIEDLTLIINDFLGKTRRSIKIHGDALKTKTDKKRVIAVLSEAEAEIEKIKVTML